MTVAELIEKLKEMPQDARVCARDEEGALQFAQAVVEIFILDVPIVEIA